MGYKIIAYCLYVGLSIVVTLIESETPFEKLESRLDTIERKLQKVDSLLDGFELLCNTLNNIKRNVNDDLSGAQDEEETPEGDQSHGGVDVDEKQRKQLEMISIESGGIKNNAIKVTVVLTTSNSECVTEWFMRRNYISELIRSQGDIYKNNIEHDKIQFTCKLTLNDIDSLQWLSLVVTSSVNNAFLNIDISALNETGIQMFSGIEYKILDYMPEIRLPGDILERDGFETTLTVTENVIEDFDRGSFHPDLAITLINTSTTPATINDIWGTKLSARDPNPTLLVSSKNGSNDELIIQLDKETAVYGGILTLRLGQNVGGYLHAFSYGVEIRVINQDVGDIISPNTFGLLKPRIDDQLVAGPYSSFFCLAFGNPVPNLSIYKKRKDGTSMKVTESYRNSYSFFVIKVLEFGPMKNNKPEGEYICRASNEDTMVENVFVLRSITTVEIDGENTKLAMNTTKKTVVTCKATGNPTPTIRMHVNHADGENLLGTQSDQYRYKFNNRKNVSKVTLVISPPIEGIRSIFCIATQSFSQASDVLRKVKEITIRPEAIAEYTTSSNMYSNSTWYMPPS